jgi:hypothetical protein
MDKACKSTVLDEKGAPIHEKGVVSVKRGILIRFTLSIHQRVCITPRCRDRCRVFIQTILNTNASHWIPLQEYNVQMYIVEEYYD